MIDSNETPRPTGAGERQPEPNESTKISAVNRTNSEAGLSGWHALIQHYLPELIYGANDGIVTTLTGGRNSGA